MILGDEYFLISQYLIKFVLLDGINFACMVCSLVQNQALGKEEVTTPAIKLRRPQHKITGPKSRILSSTSEFRASSASPTFKSSVT